MNETPTHGDILRRVEKVEIDVAVLDSKSNRLHEDMKGLVRSFEAWKDDAQESMEKVRAENRETQNIARKIQTLVVAIPAILAAIYTLIQISHVMH